MSSKKSQTSVRAIAVAMSPRCRVRRLCSSAAFHPRRVISKMKNSHALANITGASALIMRTSSSDFIICEEEEDVREGKGGGIRAGHGERDAQKNSREVQG